MGILTLSVPPAALRAAEMPSLVRLKAPFTHGDEPIGRLPDGVAHAVTTAGTPTGSSRTPTPRSKRKRP